MTTIAVTPSLAIPGREVSVAFGLTQTGTNFVRVWCTVAPLDSKLDQEIKKAATSNARAQVYEGDGGADHPWRHTFDKGGTYTLKAQEYTKGTGFGGGYQGDTRANEEEIKVGSEASLTIDIGKRMKHTLGTGPDTAELALYVFGATIYATTVALHGEATPAVSKPSSPRAATAALDANVATAIAALAGVAASTALPDPATVVSNFRTKFNAHIALTGGGVHANADSDNFLLPEPCAPPTPANISAFCTYALRLLRQHETNDSGTGAGSASSGYHQISALNVGDSLNQPLVRGVSGPEDSYAALADLWRAYEAHRVSLAVHGAADSTNSLSALPDVLSVHRYFFASLASISATAAPGDSSGAAVLKTWGFKEG